MYQRIRDLREDHDFNQTQLAKKLCISQATYWRYENGKLDVPTEIVIRLARVYHTSTDYILRLTDNPEPYQ